MEKLPVIQPRRTLQIQLDGSPHVLAVSRDAKLLATASAAQKLVIWSLEDGNVVNRHRLESSGRLHTMSWSDDGKQLLLVEGASLWVVDAVSGHTRAAWRADEPIIDATWSHDGARVLGVMRGGGYFRFVTSTSSAKVSYQAKYEAAIRMTRAPASDALAVLTPRGLMLWEPPGTKFIREIPFATGMAWSPDERAVAYLSPNDETAITVSAVRGRDLFKLEGHGSPVETCAFSADGQRLVSIDLQGVCFIWDLAARVPMFARSLARNPREPAGTSFLVFDEPLRLVEIRRQAFSVTPVTLYDLSASPGQPAPSPQAYLRHTSAKVVIAGEARVGKTSLAHRLVEDRYVEFETTHGLKFWSLPPQALSADAGAPAGERREVVLWDLGGQEEYQLIHQLFLHDTTVALLLFDPSRGPPALEEIDAWDKRLAKQIHGRPVHKLLVATKLDVEQPIDLQGIEQFVRKHGFDGYFLTSAKTPRGFGELRAAIARAIDWASLSTVSRPRLFQRIRDEIDARRRNGEVVLHYVDLERALALPDQELERENAENLFTVGDPIQAVVRQLALQGVIAETRDAQGERTLILQVGEVERYAGSLLIAARDNPSGVPALEKALFTTRVKDLPRIPQHERLEFRDERWVIECVLQLLLAHGLCVEHAGLYVFPTLFRALDPMPAEVRGATPIFYEFTGAIDNIYSSLVAAFALARRFGRMRLGKDRAEFEAEPGTVCGLRKVDQSAGVAHLDVYFGEATPAETRELFLGFVHQHLREHGVEMVERVELRCAGCGHVFDEAVLRARLAKGEDTVLCPINEHRNLITLAPRSPTPSAEEEQRIVALRGEIDHEKRQVVERARELIPREEAPPAQARAIRILHLSDLHVSAPDDVDSILGKLTDDLEDAREGAAPDGVDYLVISGDLTNRAAPEELVRAYELVSRLIDRLRLSAERCVIVPGNHDLSWDEEVYEFKMPRQVPEPRDPRRLVEQGKGFLVRNEKQYPERFRSFSRHFYHPLFQREYPLDPQEQGLTALFPEHGLQFLAFNSAWEIDEHFPERSGIHDGALERCLARARGEVEKAVAAGKLAPGTPLTRIAVWHHPVTGNEKIAADAFLERLRQVDVRLCLHGHVHEDRTDLVAHEDPARHLYAIGAGSFGAPAADRPESTPRLYNVLEIDHAHRWFRVHTRSRPRSGGAWGPWANWPSGRPGERRSFYEKSLPAPLVAGPRRP